MNLAPSLTGGGASSSLKSNEIQETPIFHAYATFPLGLGETFDCVIIDGKHRNECAQLVNLLLKRPAPRGNLVILDNSDWHKNTAKLLRERGFIEVDFHGFSPINAYTLTTSIFLSRDFCFAPKGGEQPQWSVDAIKHRED